MPSLRRYANVARGIVSFQSAIRGRGSKDGASDQSRIPHTTYALVIGINEYKSEKYPSLTGAVKDADEMEEFIMKSLGAPPAHIISLRGSKNRKAHQGRATRSAILEAFDKLDLITRDAKEPCIVIYYAGHGSSTDIPPGWENWATDGHKIEILCPSDMGTVPEGAKEVEGIPDGTICAILNKLSETRGNNITLILDCCCSAGLDRGADSQAPRVRRWIPDPPPLTAEANPPIFHFRSAHPILLPCTEYSSTRDMRVTRGFVESSHVLLAACGREAMAYEQRNRGIFTAQLLNFLSHPQRNLESETYSTMMKYLDMPPWQTPHCTGVNMDRPLFNPQGWRSDPSYIPCRKIPQPNELGYVLTLCAGEAEGIMVGEQFSIYTRLPFENQIPPQPVCSMRTLTVSASTSVLQFPEVTVAKRAFPKLPKVFYARRLDWRNDPVLIYCQDLLLKVRIFTPGRQSNENQLVMIRYVSEPEQASLVLIAEGDDVYIEWNHPLVNTYVPKRFPHRFKRSAPEDIRAVIAAWRHFNYHLHRGGQNGFPDVRMELQYLEEIDDQGPSVERHPGNYRPTGKNLIADEPAFIDIPDSDNAMVLGMTLRNDRDEAVYPYLFYFDPNDFTIRPWSLAADGAGPGDVDAPLLPGSRFSVGYGNGGAQPWSFCVEDHRPGDIGFFRLFLSRSPANFSFMAQKTSIFQRLERKERAANDLQQEAFEPSVMGVWGVKTATLIQTRL